MNIFTDLSTILKDTSNVGEQNCLINEPEAGRLNDFPLLSNTPLTTPV